jgi:AraC-like DNA-binding protein
MHDDPAHPWTPDTLAVNSGASRASLARRFRDLVGEPAKEEREQGFVVGEEDALAALDP